MMKLTFVREKGILIMKDKLYLFVLGCLWATSVVAQNQTSVEVNSFLGFPFYTSLKKIDNTLIANSRPALHANLDFGSNLKGSGYFVFRINRWGIILGGETAGIHTKPDKNGYYYDGDTESFQFGLLYDIVDNETFGISPYVTFDTQYASVHLDYEFKSGVVPTSLLITGRESGVTLGGRLYVRISHWKDKKYTLFFNTDVHYKQVYSNKWRIDNQLIKSNDFNLSHVGALVGVSFRIKL